MEKVIAAFSSKATAEKIAGFLNCESLHCVTATTCSEVKELVREDNIYVVVCGHHLKDGTCDELYNQLPKYCSMLVIAQPMQLAKIKSDIFSLNVPATKSEIQASASITIQANRKLQKYISKAPDVITEAKKLLMEDYGMTEQQAHRYIQKKSMDTGTKMAITARMIIEEHN